MIKLLDCTLRDGGYYTDWDFDEKLTLKYFEYMDKLPVEYIEVGYKSELKDEYHRKYFYLSLSALKEIKYFTSKKLAIMLNAKDFNFIEFSFDFIRNAFYKFHFLNDDFIVLGIGGKNKIQGWNPYGEVHVVIRERVSCEGCWLHKDNCINNIQCMKNIKKYKVLDGINSLLQ